MRLKTFYNNNSIRIYYDTFIKVKKILLIFYQKTVPTVFQGLKSLQNSIPMIF
jgi:hypothetical protein